MNRSARAALTEGWASVILPPAPQRGARNPKKYLTEVIEAGTGGSA
jgi:hypothetical protein